jgi:hypothetical protein
MYRAYSRELAGMVGREITPAVTSADGDFESLQPFGYRAGDANLYRYVGNDPTDKIDPSGLFEEPPSILPIEFRRPASPPPIREPTVILGQPVPMSLPPGAPAGPVSSPPSLPVVTPPIHIPVPPGPPMRSEAAPREDPPFTKTYTADSYWRWLLGNYYQGLTKEQYTAMRKVFDRGCVGITALWLGIKDPGEMPDLSRSFDTFAGAYAEYQRMQRQGPPRGLKNRYGQPSRPVLFSVRFWSEGKPYRPDRNGRVDMSGWKYEPKPLPMEEYYRDKNGRLVTSYVNFDFGLWDDTKKMFVHANHSAPGMEVKVSNKTGYSKRLLDFDKQVYCVAWEKWDYGKYAKPRKP